jgi:hypothetical protein
MSLSIVTVAARPYQERPWLDRRKQSKRNENRPEEIQNKNISASVIDE